MDLRVLYLSNTVEKLKSCVVNLSANYVINILGLIIPWGVDKLKTHLTFCSAIGALKRMSHAVLLCLKVLLVMRIRGYTDWDLLGNLEIVTFKPDDFFRIVGHEFDFSDS